MKGKERSPVKAKRSRGAEESSRERCGKKLSSTSCGNDSGSAAKSSESSSGRRGLHLDKGLTSNRDYESSGRAPGIHSYGSPVASSGSGSSSKGAEGRGGAVPRSSDGRGEVEYKSLRISELGSSLSDEAVEDGLFHEFKKFGDVSVKISRSGDERVALVNFRRPEDARAAKHARGRLVLYDRPLKIEAVYATGSSRRRSRSPGDKEPYSSLSAAVSSLPSHRHPHSQRGLSPGGLGYRDYRLQQLALGRLPPPPPPPLPRDLDRDRDYNFYESRMRPAYPLDPRLNIREDDGSENDIRANRTLFLGNLDINVTESELRRAFERFGTITEVDIKRTTRGQSSTYGFIKFENLDMAQRAKLAMSGKLILRNCIKIGYGKATPTNRLWVGGLGHWVPMASLAREFDRFGTIRSIDYRKGDSWAYIQYESLDAAQAACSQMRGFPLGGDHRRLRVDFADTDHVYQTPYLQPLSLPHYDLVGDAFPPRAPDSLRARDRTSPLLYRERERDLYGDSDWVPLPIRDRNRVPYDSVETLDRRVDGWSLDRERERDGVNKEQPRKRRLIDEARHVDRSPESDRSRKRHCTSPDRSPDGSGGRDGRFSDTDRANSRTEQSSPSRDWRGSLERGLESKRDHKNSSSVERDRKHRVSENKSPLRKDERVESISKVKSLQKQDANQNLCLAWQGMLLLKNSNFPSNMHLLQGDLAVATGLLIEGSTGGKVAQLKITQRLRLDQPKLDEVTRRIKVAGPNGYAVLLAVPGTNESNFTGDQASSTQRPLRNLVSYLKQKQAAGVISLPVGGTKDKENTGVLHAFPPCEFSQQFLDSTAKALAKSEDDYLVMIIVRGAS